MEIKKYIEDCENDYKNGVPLEEMASQLADLIGRCAKGGFDGPG